MDNALVAATMLGLAMALAPAAGAAELKVLAGGSMTASLKELGPLRARDRPQARHPVCRRARADQDGDIGPFDVAVVPVEVVKNDAVRAKLGPTTDVAQIGFGVAVRAGAPKPDVSTPEAFKAALLKAQSVTFLPESSAGGYVLKVFERLGIAEAMKAKTRPQTSPGAIPQAVAKGDAELGIFLTNVLIAPGVELAGPFPGDLQLDFVLTAAVAKETGHADVAKAFLAFLKTEEAAAVFKAKGVTPK